jgi:predicted permease
VDPGFRGERVLAARLAITPGQLPGRALPAFYGELLGRLEALPGVVAAAAATMPPHQGGNDQVFQLMGGTVTPAAARSEVILRAVSPSYLRALGIRLQAGRGFTEADGPDAPAVALVNAAFVRRHLPGQDPIGRDVRVDTVVRTIVGVTGDVRQDGPRRPAREEILVPLAQRAGLGMTLLIRTAYDDPGALAGAVGAAVASVNGQVAIARIGGLDAWMDEALAQTRARTYLLGAFALVAFLLAALGVYGVVAYAVDRRTREVGVRLALGATGWQVQGVIVRGTLKLAAVGVAAGLAGALLLTGALDGLLFEVRETDPLSFVAAAVGLLAAAVVAGYLPARRAARVDPVVALRAE